MQARFLPVAIDVHPVSVVTKRLRGERSIVNTCKHIFPVVEVQQYAFVDL